MSEFAPICIYLVISLLVSLIPLGRRNSLIAPYEFTMEKVLFVVRSLKEKLVINLESLLLHGNEDFREKILKREEKRRKSQNKTHMARKGNPISGGMFNVLFRISIVVFFVFTVYFLSLVLGFDLSLIWVKLKSMLLLRSFRFLFCRLLGWEVPLILVLCIVGSVVGSSFHMMDPDRASASSGGSNSISVGGRSEMGGSSRGSGWTSFDLDVLAEEEDEVVRPPLEPGTEDHIYQAVDAINTSCENEEALIVEKARALLFKKNILLDDNEKKDLARAMNLALYDAWEINIDTRLEEFRKIKRLLGKKNCSVWNAFIDQMISLGNQKWNDPKYKV